MEPQYEQVGKAFIQHYYQAFDTNRAALADLYQGESMSAPPTPTPFVPDFPLEHTAGPTLLRSGDARCATRDLLVRACGRLSFEGAQVAGREAIVQKLTVGCLSGRRP